MRITKYRKSLKIAFIFTKLAIYLLGMILLAEYVPFEKTGDNIFQMSINGVDVGTVADPDEAKDWVTDARKEIALESEELVFMEVSVNFEGDEILWGKIDEEKQVKEKIHEVLENSVIETMQRSFTVKVKEYMANLAGEEEVRQLLQAAVDKYDTQGNFAIELHQDTEREFNVLEAEVVDTILQEQRLESEEAAGTFPQAGIHEQLTLGLASYESEEKDFEDYDLGIKSMGFSEGIEIVESYLPASQLKSLEQAIQELTEEQEQQVIYKVVSGDTLSEIAIKVNIPMDDIIAMNDSLESENSILQIGQELIITVPEPELSVVREEVNYYEEIYDAEVIYIDNEDWYTTKSVVLQQPSAGFRKVIAQETFVNKELTEREILKEEVVMEAVPKIVERGTKVPPSYIKPLSGGRLTSKFGRRSAPVPGASTNHKGTDWATPVGTSVVASSGGTVAKAGWGSGYGYVVYINHPDGNQTRYAHLSKVLVKVGQTVKQGERIALSGNTGRTSGPHVHFELLINGTQVDAQKYIK